MCVFAHESQALSQLQAVRSKMVPDLPEENEEGEFLFRFTIHPGSIFISGNSSSSVSLVFALTCYLSFFFSFFLCDVFCTDVQEGWQFRPPPRGVTSSEEYTLCKRYSSPFSK